MAVVVSPLISLMKDQVDALRANGISATYINSSLGPAERRATAAEVRAGRIKLLYVAPERLVQSHTIEFLKGVGVSLFAIDEAHCISEWGHDFRPEYRELRKLKVEFPTAAVHAYTATATEPVRGDIAEQLGLDDPVQLVGNFDRPNLIFRVTRRSGLANQIREIVDRHRSEAGIVYCLSRAEVEETCTMLVDRGYRAVTYHAGMSDVDRNRNQDAFLTDRADIVVATIAFGMGIDKPNVRFVIHAGMPKSLENYQQESGRAGRDGLEAECCLLYSGSDIAMWKRRVEESDPGAQPASQRALRAIADYCTHAVCRHRALVRYFGQDLPGDRCQACDVCLGDVDLMSDSQVVGQKILSSVVRQQQRFGGEYTALVLKGSKDQRILQNGHDRLTTFGLLADFEQRTIRDWIEQLVGQEYLTKSGEYNVLQVTPLGWQLLRGEVQPRLTKPAAPVATAAPGSRKRRTVADDSWEGVDRELFDELRKLRRERAEDLGVPAYIVFGDASLRDMARKRPTTLDGFRGVKGVGDKKTADFGAEFTGLIGAFCREHGVTSDQ